MDQMQKGWHRYHYKNLTYLLVGLVMAALLVKNEYFRAVLVDIGSFGYIGAFIGGLLFVSTFTATIGIVVISILTQTLHPLEIGLVAGLGSVVGDLLIFKYIRSKGLTGEIKRIYKHFGGDKISHLVQTKYFGWSLPVLGSLIIMSPLPDELGVGLMGISKLKTYQFAILSYFLNSIGIIAVILASLVLK